MKNIDFKEKDIIIAFHSGFHKVTKITKRFKPLNGRGPFLEDPNHPNCGEEMNPLVQYIKVFDENGSEIRQSFTEICDGFYCELAINKIDEFILNHQNIIQNLKLLKSQLSNV